MNFVINQTFDTRHSFCQWYAAGFEDLISVIPPDAQLSLATAVKPDQRGKVPGIKGREGWHGFDWRNHVTTEADVSRWDGDGANTGLRAGHFPGLDIDVTDERLANLIRAVAEQHLGIAPVRIGRAPKMLLVYRLAPGQELMTRRRLWFKDPEGNSQLIEMLGDGQQYVVDGRHPTTGRPYMWDRHPADGCVDDLTPVSKIQIDEFFADLEAGLVMFDCESFVPEGTGCEAHDRTRHNQDDLRAPCIEKVAELVRVISNTSADFPDRTAYLKMGYAIKASLPDDPDTARGLFVEWAMSWNGNDRYPAGNDEHTVLADWQRMKYPFSVGYDYLRARAAEQGYVNAVDDFIAITEENGGTLTLDAPRYAPCPQRIPDGFSPSDLPVRPWVLGRRFLRGAVTVGIGAPGVAKSTMTLLSALAIATGRADLTGESVRVGGRVWIHNNEDDSIEILRRLSGLCLYFDIRFEDIRDRFLFSSGIDRRLLIAVKNKDQVKQTEAVAELINIIKDRGIVFMGVDPFISTHTGTEENSNDDVEAVASIFRYIAQKADIAIDLVHHSVKNHSGNSEARAGDLNASRGAGALGGAVRVSYTLVHMDERTAKDLGIDRRLAARLLRMDGAKGNYSARSFEPIWFELKSVDVGNGGGVDQLLMESDSVGVPVLRDLAALAAGNASSMESQATDFAERSFIEALSRFEGEGVMVSERERAGSYAPRVIAKSLGAGAPRTRDLEQAMYRLLEKGLVEIGRVGQDKYRHAINGLKLTQMGQEAMKRFVN
ncbi:MAG: AAA family ATPase [Rhodospirillaceae bacterium]